MTLQTWVVSFPIFSITLPVNFGWKPVAHSKHSSLEYLWNGGLSPKQQSSSTPYEPTAPALFSLLEILFLWTTLKKKTNNVFLTTGGGHVGGRSGAPHPLLNLKVLIPTGLFVTDVLRNDWGGQVLKNYLNNAENLGTEAHGSHGKEKTDWWLEKNARFCKLYTFSWFIFFWRGEGKQSLT